MSSQFGHTSEQEKRGKTWGQSGTPPSSIDQPRISLWTSLDTCSCPFYSPIPLICFWRQVPSGPSDAFAHSQRVSQAKPATCRGPVQSVQIPQRTCFFRGLVGKSTSPRLQQVTTINDRFDCSFPWHFWLGIVSIQIQLQAESVRSITPFFNHTTLARSNVEICGNYIHKSRGQIQQWLSIVNSNRRQTKRQQPGQSNQAVPWLAIKHNPHCHQESKRSIIAWCRPAI